MDKLIELRCLIKPLEEYLLELAKKNPLYTNFNVNLPGVSILGVHETIIISKKFGFIQWLVDNDKINRTDLGKREMMLSCTKYENLLMRLAISHTPIEDLVSYLR